MVIKEQDLRAAVENASSIKEVIQNLGRRVNNGGYQTVKAYAIKYDIELPKFDYSVTQKTNLKSFDRLSDEEYFSDNIRRSGANLRERLIQFGREYVCSGCGLPPEWNGKPLTLQVDHIDGNKFNNQLDNLRFLCANCHTQTDTYARSNGLKKYNYCECGERIGKKSTVCMNHRSVASRSKINWPPVEELLDKLARMPYTSVAGELGVSDNAVRKYLQRNGYSPKTLAKE